MRRRVEGNAGSRMTNGRRNKMWFFRICFSLNVYEFGFWEAGFGNFKSAGGTRLSYAIAPGILAFPLCIIWFW